MRRRFVILLETHVRLAVQRGESVRTMALKLGGSGRDAGGDPATWRDRRGLRARVGSMARYVYWKLGGYRRFRRVRWARVKRLVFVCTGNICRSPYAERLAHARSLAAVSVGVDTSVGSPADPVALRVAHDRGIPMDGHRTKPLGDLEPQEGDLFVAMEPFQAALVAKQRWPVRCQVTLLGLWCDSDGPVIPDPYGGDERRFNHCFSTIERGIDGIQRRLEAASEPPRSEVPHSRSGV